MPELVPIIVQGKVKNDTIQLNGHWFLCGKCPFLFFIFWLKLIHLLLSWMFAPNIGNVREAFKKEIRWKLGHCPNSSGSLPSLPRLGRISENQKYFITLLCVLSHSEYVIFSAGTLMWRLRVPPLPVGTMYQLWLIFF